MGLLRWLSLAVGMDDEKLKRTVAGFAVLLTTVTERGATRMDDQTSEASMERRKKEGYF